MTLKFPVYIPNNKTKLLFKAYEGVKNDPILKPTTALDNVTFNDIVVQNNFYNNFTPVLGCV